MFNKKMAKNADEKRGIERFRRVKEETVEVDPRVKDNSFEAKVSVCPYLTNFSLIFFLNGTHGKRKRQEMTHNCTCQSFILIGTRKFFFFANFLLSDVE